MSLQAFLQHHFGNQVESQESEVSTMEDLDPPPKVHAFPAFLTYLSLSSSAKVQRSEDKEASWFDSAQETEGY